MTRKDVHRYLVAYDVPDDRRRLAIAKVLQSFGDRIQYSVFVVEASAVKRARCERAVLAAMRPEVDSVILCDLGPADVGESARLVMLGRRRSLTERSSFVL